MLLSSPDVITGRTQFNSSVWLKEKEIICMNLDNEDKSNTFKTFAGYVLIEQGHLVSGVLNR